jgi:hypothetical protein
MVSLVLKVKNKLKIPVHYASTSILLALACCPGQYPLPEPSSHGLRDVFIYVTGCLYPMTIEWVPSCTGRVGAVVRPWGEGQRSHCPYPVDRWHVSSNTLSDDRIGLHHPRTLIWAAKRYSLSHIVKRIEFPGPWWSQIL